MNMPKICPLSTDIKDKHVLARIWHWQTFIREWEILEDWELELPGEDTKIVIPKGFVFDGVSVPRPLHWFLSPTGILFIPGLVHDFAYRYDYLWAVDENGKFYQYKKDSGRYHWDGLFRCLGVSLNGMRGLNFFARIVLFVFGRYSWKYHRKYQALEIRPSKIDV